MSFGKRQTGERENTRRSRPEPQVTPVRKVSWSKAILGLAIAAFGAVIYISGERTVSISPTPWLYLMQTKKADAWEFGSCILQPHQMGFRSVGPLSDTDEDPFKRGFKQLVGGEEAVVLLNSAKFIECVTTDEVKQLCDREVRTAFASDVSRFYKMYNAVFVEPHSVRNPTDPKFAALLQTLNDALPDIDIAKSEVDLELQSSKELVDKALGRAIEKGAIAKADFGWFAHQDVRAVFASAKPAQQALCQ